MISARAMAPIQALAEAMTDLFDCGQTLSVSGQAKYEKTL
jgi:hypothetical protein